MHERSEEDSDIVLDDAHRSYLAAFENLIRQVEPTQLALELRDVCLDRVMQGVRDRRSYRDKIDPMNLPRNWEESNLPRPGGPSVPEDLKTEVYCGVERVIWESREDPFALGIALAAWCRLGYPPGNYTMAMESKPNWAKKDDQARLSTTEAIRLADASLKGRRRRDLTARADGLIVGLLVLARDAKWARLHEVRVDAAVIECRELSTEERGRRLREMSEQEEDRAA